MGKWKHRYTHLQQAGSSNNASYLYSESVHPKSPSEHTTHTQMFHGFPQAYAAIVSLIQLLYASFHIHSISVIILPFDTDTVNSPPFSMYGKWGMLITLILWMHEKNYYRSKFYSLPHLLVFLFWFLSKKYKYLL
jgi:hypothetical protein